MNYKTNIILLAGFVCLLLLSSCSTSTKITINAKPGTVFPLYDKENLKMVKCDNSGSVTYRQSDDNYVGLTYSYDKEGNLIPFAFDYGKRVHAATVFNNLGLGVSAVGLFGSCIGLIGMVASGGDDSMTEIALGGLGVTCFGLSFGWPSETRAEQSAYKYHYRYKRYQKTNQDLSFTMPEITLLDPPQSYHDATGITKSINPSNTDNGNSNDVAVSSKTLGERSSKKLSSNADKVSGTYVGTGSLKQSGATIENYQNISVTIVKVSSNVVGVNVVESNGDRFFSSNLEYDIQVSGIGSYTLVNKKTNDAKITISMNSLDYIHPRVNIEGDIYQLHISASKQ